MKKLLLLALLFLNVELQAQTFLQKGAEWNQSIYEKAKYTILETKSKYIILRDTSLFNKKYFILKEYFQFNTLTRKDTSIDKWDTKYGEMYFQYSFLREESKRIYRLNSANIDMLVYDFSIEAGDRFENAVYAYGCPDVFGLYFEKEDSVCLGGKRLKRWKVSEKEFSSADFLIEGIGPNTGIFTPFCKSHCPNCLYTLHYFTMNGDTLYMGDCSKTLSLKEEFSANKMLVTYYPDGVHVEASEDGKLQLSDLSGQELYSQIIKLGASVIIPYFVYKPGIYILHFRTKSSDKYSKIQLE